ncbi:DNA (cytosine-5-)-methyltransferase [Clostridium botulinum]|uniref:DNA (cytosine-5-)-methyltransferase n=1 Tax=Clostridium botulinum TaxID=1491 RepID=UPI0004D9B3F4|nr:DNA (cytosine-5-)-methyltransferase [Clostridium botulinum]KEH96461.1 putative cytosine-specific DNA methylotransferase [Clostridium botulinum D str. 16868]
MKIKLFDSFAGIGSLHKALKNIGVDVELVGMSEIDVDAIISYSGVHQINNKIINFPTKEEMVKYLEDRNIGYDFKKGKNKAKSLRLDKLKKVYEASVSLKNYGDISIIDPNELPDFDLFNFSFCCQDISISGKQKGFIDESGNKTRSGLYVDGIRVIKAKKPKYIMIENVKNLISKKFVNDFEDIINELKEIGYNTYVLTNDKGKYKCLNAKNFGIPQNRERIFVIGIREYIDNKQMKFNEGKDYGYRLKDILQNQIDERFYIDNDKCSILLEKLDDEVTKIKQATKKGYDEATVGDSINLEQPNSKTRRGRVGHGVAQTLTCSCNQGTICQKNYSIRKLTPLECWRLMGFTDIDFYNTQKLGISDSQLYKQAGNSIVVQVLMSIFINLFDLDFDFEEYLHSFYNQMVV